MMYIYHLYSHNIWRRHLLVPSPCRKHKTLLTPEVQVLLGEHDTSDNVADRHNISAITPHPRYNETTADFDFAVITLAAPVNFSAAVAPICLPGAEASLYTGETATITGWGHTSSGGAPSPLLLETNVTVISNENCTSSYGSRINRYKLGSKCR